MILTVCMAQVLAQIGAYAVPALLPSFIDMWSLDNSEAGWIIAAFYGGYVLAAPFLVSLTDRIPAKWIYVAAVSMTAGAHLGYAYLADGFWSALVFRVLAGIGWAGSYMPGLRTLTDVVTGKPQSRAVALHAGSLGLSGSASFVIAGTIAVMFDWRAAFIVSGLAAVGAAVLALSAMPSNRPAPPKDGKHRRLLDFRPAFRNRSSLAYSIVYCVHTWEMNALRGWVVTYLAFTAGLHGGTSALIAPAAVATLMGVTGTLTSVAGNEISIRIGRPRLIMLAMAASMIMAVLLGTLSGIAYWAAALGAVVYGVTIWLDSSSLTAGAVGNADPEHKGATMTVHTFLGYGGGFVGPFMIGWVLDLAGGQSVLGWTIAFGHVAVVMLVGVTALAILRPKALEGDR
ncbi:MAG: MFS transporter [Rhodospirillaceae bacterium]|nr:MFS transporter [Rhodospirillaceae bacterium]